VRQHVFAFVSGALFTLGLSVAGMTDPAKVRAFLDFAGDWDPSLALVMVGAIGVYALIHRWSQGREQPWHAAEFSAPARRRVDARLIAGAALFGAGWGLAGLCPGPAWSALGTGSLQIAAFVAAMLAGMSLVRAAEDYSARRARDADG
jgi:uncharacterized protein